MKSFLFCLIGLVLAGCAASPNENSAKPVYGKTNPSPQQKSDAKIKRFASVIELKPEKEQLYRKLHADVWPEVLAAIKNANIQNYNIFITKLDGKKYLFSYLEYTGDDIEKDFASLLEEKTVRKKWLPLTDACQKVLPSTPEGQQWKPMEMLMSIP